MVTRPVTFTLGELASHSGGELIGDPQLVITGAASLTEAVEGEITFFSNPKYSSRLGRTRASALFAPVGFDKKLEKPQIRVADPERSFQEAALKWAPRPIEYAPTIHPTAIIAADAKLGARVSIQPYAVIEPGVTIGDDTVIGANSYVGHESAIGSHCLIYPRVTIRERTLIGARVIIHSGAVVGADGFGFEVKDGRQQKIPQIGIVQIDDDVEIGANTTIDRARFGRTWIREDAKIDNLVQIGHNVVVGKHTVIASQVGIAGSSRIGEYVVIGGQAGLVGHIEVGDRILIAGRSAVMKSLPGDTGIWGGIPAAPLRKTHERLAWINRLGDLFSRVKALEKKLESWSRDE